MNEEQILREHLIANLDGGHAHMSFAEAVKDFPLKHINTKPPHVTYSFWQLLEHIRITQKDILDFIIDPAYKEPKWPDDYWPKQDGRPTDWKKTISQYEKDITAVVKLLKDKKANLFTKLPQGTGQTILREALTIADHASYHIGEFAILRQVMGIWPKDHK